MLTPPPIPVLTPAWNVAPGQLSFYINSVATDAEAKRVVCGTFYHAYSSQSRHDPSLASKEDPSDPQTGLFGCYCYDNEGNELWADEFQAWQGVYWVDISSNGAYAASGGWFSGNPYAGFVRAYDASNGRMLLNKSTHKRVNQVCLSADGGWLLAAAESLMLFKYSSSGYTQTDEFSPASPDDQIVAAALSSDGGTAVCTTLKGKILLFVISSGNLVESQSWTMPAGYSHCIRITPTGASFVAGGAAGMVNVFDSADFIKSGQPSQSIPIAQSGSIYGVAISDDGNTIVGLVNVGDAGQVVCMSRANGQASPVWSKPTPTDRNPNCASLNESAGFLAVADGHPDDTPGNFYLISTMTGAILGKFGTQNMSWPIMLSRNGKAMVAGSDDSNLYYFPL